MADGRIPFFCWYYLICLPLLYSLCADMLGLCLVVRPTVAPSRAPSFEPSVSPTLIPSGEHRHRLPSYTVYLHLHTPSVFKGAKIQSKLTSTLGYALVCMPCSCPHHGTICMAHLRAHW